MALRAYHPARLKLRLQSGPASTHKYARRASENRTPHHRLNLGGPSGNPAAARLARKWLGEARVSSGSERTRPLRNRRTMEADALSLPSKVKASRSFKRIRPRSSPPHLGDSNTPPRMT